MKCFKKIIVLFFLTYCTNAISGRYVSITIYGGPGQCETWNKVNDSGFSKSLNDGFNGSWIAGYMSGTNAAKQQDIFDKISVTTAIDFISNYCKSHPSKSASDGMDILIDKLSSVR